MKSNDLSTAEAFRPDHLDRSQWICMAKAQYAAFEGKFPPACGREIRYT